MKRLAKIFLLVAGVTMLASVALAAGGSHVISGKALPQNTNYTPASYKVWMANNVSQTSSGICGYSATNYTYFMDNVNNFNPSWSNGQVVIGLIEKANAAESGAGSFSVSSVTLSDATASQNFTPDLPVLANIPQPTATVNAGAGRVDLAWTAASGPAGTIVGYNVYRSTDGTNYTKINDTLVAGTSYSDTAANSSPDPVVGATYTYAIRVVFTGPVELTNRSLKSNSVVYPPQPVAPGTLQLSNATYSVNENGGSVSITVTRTGGSGGAASINYATSNGTAVAGTDYTAASGTLNWTDGDAASKSFTVPITDDIVIDGNKTVNLTLSGAAGATLGAPSTAILTINDNESPVQPGALQFNAATYSVAENGGTVTITVTRTGGSSGAVGISYATSNGTATAGSDYTAASGTLSWTDGDAASKTFTVAIANDTAVEANETVNLTLSAPSGGATLGTPNTATLTINDDDGTGPTISGITPSTAAIGTPITISGTNFGASQGGSTVTVGGVAATPTSWSATSITTTVPTGTPTGTATVVVTVGGQTATGSITVTPAVNAIVIDDFEGNCVGTWSGAHQDSGYYAYGTGITPESSKITSQGPTAEALKNGARGMKVKYSFTSGWGGGWGAKLINTLDLTAMTKLTMNVKWDGSSNDLKVSLKDSDGTTVSATILNATLAALGSYNQVSVDQTAFAYDAASSLPDAANGYPSPDATMNWNRVVSYSITYPSTGTTANYQNIDDITAQLGNVSPTTEVIITSITPASAPTGARVVVSGRNFGTAQGSSTLTFNNLLTGVSYPAQIMAWSDGSIEAIVPPTAPIGSYNVVVNRIAYTQGTVNAMQSNPEPFSITNSGVETAHIYPNPFDPNSEIVHIVFTQPAGATNIGVYIYDMTARLVGKQLISSGQTTWNGKDQQNLLVGDGAFLLRVVNEDTKTLIAKGKILVVKR